MLMAAGIDNIPKTNRMIVTDIYIYIYIYIERERYIYTHTHAYTHNLQVLLAE